MEKSIKKLKLKKLEISKLNRIFGGGSPPIGTASYFKCTSHQCKVTSITADKKQHNGSY